MRAFWVEPRDPLIARDGRPAALGRLESLPFPLPSTLAGAARTRMASAMGAFDLALADAERLLTLAVHGPLLAEMREETLAGFFAPAPRDAMLFEEPGAEGKADAVLRRRLAPIAMPAGVRVDSLERERLSALGFAGLELASAPREKPLARPPAFWDWATFQAWLCDCPDASNLDLACCTLDGLPRERRIHLAIEPGERIGVEGALFETEGLRFLAGPERRLAPRRLALALRAEEDGEGRLLGRPLSLRAELAPLGGERRLARWRPSEVPWPGLAESVRTAVVTDRRARLVLLTPAHFSAGALPGWNGLALPGAPGVSARVAAACVSRPVVVSGWDLGRGCPKATRRLAAAGSVYFLDLAGDDEAIAAWCTGVWLQPVSDTEQARRDGFGLAALGVWPKETP